MKYLFFVLLMVVTGNALADDDGTTEMNITGTITAEGCNVDTASSHQNIKIGDFDSGTFSTVGSVSSSVALPITLDNCSSNIKGAKITFSGTADSTNPDLLALNSGTSMASGVGVQILDSSNTPIAINGTSVLQTLTAGNTNTLNFNLRYKSTQYPVQPGDASAILYFDMDYQ